MTNHKLKSTDQQAKKLAKELFEVGMAVTAHAQGLEPLKWDELSRHNQIGFEAMAAFVIQNWGRKKSLIITPNQNQ